MATELTEDDLAQRDEVREIINDGEFEVDEELVSKISRWELSNIVIILSLSFQNHLCHLSN